MIPVRYHRIDFDGEPAPTSTTHTPPGLGVGPVLHLRVDLDSLLIYGNAFYNPMESGLLFETSTGIVLPFSREYAHVAVPCTPGRQGEYVPPSETGEYICYRDNYVPSIHGLVVGASLARTAEAVVSAVGIQEEHRRDGKTLASIQAGYGLVSAQAEALGALQLDVLNLNPGVHWLLKYGYPVFGPVPIYFLLTGDHYIGRYEAIAFTHSLSVGIGLGTSLSVSSE
jgi:hypothetical protein